MKQSLHVPASESADVQAAPARTAAMVLPLARALKLLSAFSADKECLANKDLVARTGYPPSTVSRLVQTLVGLGYLHHEVDRRAYRLTAAVLSLGFGAFSNSEVQSSATRLMQAFADQHNAHVVLCARYRLELTILEVCSSSRATLGLSMHAGRRIGLFGSPIGWAMLSALPTAERSYLQNNLKRRMPNEWRSLSRRCGDAIGQIAEKGYCCSLGDVEPGVSILAVPLKIRGQEPKVLAYLDAAFLTSRQQVDQHLGPRLLSLAAKIEKS